VLAALDEAISGAPDEVAMIARARALARVAIEGLISRRARFDALSSFAQTHLRLESDNFTLDGFDVAPGQRRKPLVMSFKKPTRSSATISPSTRRCGWRKMIVAYDFDRQLNPFVELGGFLFTFMGDGAPGTGKTILIQMLAGMINDYCRSPATRSTTRISASTRSRPTRASRDRTARLSSTTCSIRGRSVSAPSTTSTRSPPSARTTGHRPASRKSPRC
jgi:hypothetical protein